MIVTATRRRKLGRQRVWTPFCVQCSVRPNLKRREFCCTLTNMATATGDEWTEEKCLQLIREYRARPILWDTKDPFFFKKSMKPVAWEEIGAAINICPDQCKHKMIILTSSFRREKAKIIQSLKNLKDPSQAYKSTWFAFKELAFLLDKDAERKRQLKNSYEIEDYNENCNIKLALLSHYVDSPAPKKHKPSISTNKEVTQKVAPKAQQEIIATQVTKQLPTRAPSQTPAERDEEIKSFTSFIGNKMKKYSDTTKNSVQQAICEIIFKADQNCYENSYDKFAITDDEADPLTNHDEEDKIIKTQDESDSD